MRKALVFSFLLVAAIHQGRAEIPDNDGGPNESRLDDNNSQIIQQKNSFNKQLGEVEKLYGKTTALLKALQGHVEQRRQNLSKIRQEMHSLNGELTKQHDELAGQIKAAYAMGQKEKLKLLLNQEDPALSSRMLVYYDYLNKARLAKLADITETLQHLDQLGKRQEQETELLEKNILLKKSEQLTAEDIRKRRANLLLQFRDDPSSNGQQIIYLKESEIKLKNLVSSLQKSTNDLSFEVERSKKLHQPDYVAPEPGKDLPAFEEEPSKQSPTPSPTTPGSNGDFSLLKGQLSWPVKGRLVNKFGSKRTESAESIWDGVLIDASEGTEIRAITSGKVAFSDWLRGYGLLIIIDHGKGYMSLYAFNQSLYRQAGDWVNVGDVIASVGQSGGRSHSGLYFGIRNNGKPVDPLEWCRK